MTDDLSESEIQRAVFSHLRERAMPGAVFWHVPNDKSSRRKAGYLEGVHDVHALHKGRFYTIELKKDKGRPTEKQIEFRDRVNGAGGFAVVAEGLPQALCILESWGILRPAHNHNAGVE
jgi:hypothetical protein